MQNTDKHRALCIYFSHLEERMIARRRYNIAAFARRQYHRNVEILLSTQGGAQRV